MLGRQLVPYGPIDALEGYTEAKFFEGPVPAKNAGTATITAWVVSMVSGQGISRTPRLGRSAVSSLRISGTTDPYGEDSDSR